MFAVAAMLKNTFYLIAPMNLLHASGLCSVYKYANYSNIINIYSVYSELHAFSFSWQTVKHTTLTNLQPAWNATKGQPVYEERNDFGLKPIGVLNQDPETCLLFCLVVRRLDKDRKARFGGGGVVNRNAGLLLLWFSQHCFKCRKWSCNMLNMQDAALSANPAGRSSTPILT